MAKLILLGTGAAWSGPERESTFLLVQGERTNILIDCAGSPTQRLARVGVSPDRIDHLILTHNHPDHIYGLSVFMLNAWMAGRQAPLPVYGLPGTLRSARTMLRAVDIARWPQFFKLRYHVIAPNSTVQVLQADELVITAMPTVHFVPTVGLRVTNRATSESIAYTADTAPHPNIVELARGAKILLHEATELAESTAGHSSAADAGQAARLARVKELVLLHLPPAVRADKWRAAARRKFRGAIHIAQDFDSFEF